MLQYSDLTVVNNSAGIPTALGYPINSFMLQNNRPLFVGGGKKERKNGSETSPEKGNSAMDLAVPAGLVCMTETICTKAIDYDEHALADSAYAEDEIIPDSLYERLMELAETKPTKKMTKRRPIKLKNKTKKVIKKTRSKK
jgi:hypothetical protein